MNQWKGRNEVSTSDGGPMIGRDESNPSVFKTAKLKEYPRDLSAGLAQTMIDQIARLHRLGSSDARPAPEVSEALVNWRNQAMERTAVIRCGATMLPDFQGQ